MSYGGIMEVLRWSQVFWILYEGEKKNVLRTLRTRSARKNQSPRKRGRSNYILLIADWKVIYLRRKGLWLNAPALGISLADPSTDKRPKFARKTKLQLLEVCLLNLLLFHSKSLSQQYNSEFSMEIRQQQTKQTLIERMKDSIYS